MKRTPRTIRRLALLLGAAASLAPASQAATSAEPLFVPVLKENFPDPFILKVGQHFLGYSTTSAGRNVPMAASTDLVTWRIIKDEKDTKKPYDAMPTLPSWAKPGFTWAPEVLAANGGYVLYFSAPHRKLDVQCIGAATSSDPLGPFISQSAEPLVCQPKIGGTIDAHPFRDTDGQLYLYDKNDGNNPRFLKPSQIWAQKLSADGLRLEGQAVTIETNDKHWEWRVVEAPTMVHHAGGYTLFFSGNHFGWEADQRLSNYGIGYATCTGPMGPCTDAGENPWLRSYYGEPGCLSGPGHPAVFEAGKRSFIAFHAWAANAGCRPAKNERYLYVAPLGFEGAKPIIGPSLRPKAMPGK
jgi:beta-xylosidase